MRKFLLSILALAFVLSFTHCTYDKYDKLHVTAPIQDTIKGTISYKKEIIPILNAHCYRCHDAANGASKGKGIFLYTHAGIANWTSPNDSSCQLIESLTRLNTLPSLYMPNDSSKIPDAEILRIVKWVKQGAIEN